MTPLVFAFPGHEALAGPITERLHAQCGTLRRHRFPDGESLIALDADCRGREVIVLCTLRDPDDLALPLLFAARTAREFGARRVGLVAPYLAYMRQDARFHPGEAISSTHYATFLSWTFDWLVTVDPHLHRHADLAEIFTIPAACVSAMPLVADWIRNNVTHPVLVGPDAESAQWVGEAAARAGAPLVVLQKQRRGDRDVDVSRPDPALLRERTPVLVDDIASSGRTLIETVGQLRGLGCAAPVCVVVHGIFADAAERTLLAAGAARVVSTNTISHATNAIDVGPLLAAAVERMLETARPTAAAAGRLA